ncbi:MAG: T9SS type A sorting domain-containing protein, partial [Melioribacteraceae bacterium]|nr:T9SS type A sorting domain-containing protein [Melioribacteraceae bacterium]
FGDEERNSMNSVQQTSDGGYILGGSTVLPDEDFTDMYIVKTDALGEIEWETVYGDDETESVSTILQTDDGGYLAFGKTDSYGAGKFDFLLVKLNSTGTVIWEKTYGGNRDEKSSDMIETTDGNYFLLGNTLSFGDGLNADVYLIKINGEGTELWSTRYGGPSGDSGDKIVATQDGNYSILASTSSIGAGGFDIWLIKIDGIGGELWNKTFGGSEDEEGNDMTELHDASLVMVGFTRTFGAGAKDAYIIKTDASGNKIWEQTHGQNLQDAATNVVSESDGIIYTLSLATTIEGAKVLIIKADFDGNEIWQSQINGGANDLALNSESHIIVAGSTGKYGNDTEVYFLNVNQLGDITAIEDQPLQKPISFKLNNNYPNPFNNQTKISFQLSQTEHVELSIYNIMGQKIKTLISDVYSAGTHSIGFNSYGLASGVYFYQLKTNTGMMVKQMMLLK